MPTQTATTSHADPRTLHRRTSHSSSASQKKPWQQHARRPSFRSGHSKSGIRPDPEEQERLSRHTSRRSTRSKIKTPKWWKIHLFRGMIDDVKRRAPFYLSDWTDAWDYRVVPATVYMYFAKYEYSALRPPPSRVLFLSYFLFDGNSAGSSLMSVRAGFVASISPIRLSSINASNLPISIFETQPISRTPTHTV